MKLILRYIKKYKIEAVLAPLFKMTEALLELFVPLVIAAIIDNKIPAADYSGIIKHSLILLALGFAGLAFSATAQYLSARAAVRTAADIKSALFKHISGFSYTQLDKIGAATLITEMTSDINLVQSGINLTLRLFLRSPFIVFGAMIMAFTIDSREALIFAVMIAILSLIVFTVMGVTVPRHRKVQRGLDALTLSVRENVNGARVIRAFRSERSETEKFDIKNSALNKMQVAVARITSLTNPLTLVVVNIAVAVLLKIGAVKVFDGDLSAGAVVALYNYLTQILVELVKLANLIVSITKSIAGADRIETVFGITPDYESGALTEIDSECKTAISFENVSFKYDGSSEYSLEDISFTLNKGQTLGIIGSTGSGKSTLVNLLAAFYKADSGVIKFFGHPVESYNSEFLHSALGFCAQKAVLFKGSIRDNMKIGKPDATDGEIISALKTAQAFDFVNEKPGFLDFELEENARNLSGGQKQRLTLARALVKRPLVFISDDCSSALDLATDARLRKALSELDDITKIIVSQRVSAVISSDKILVLEDGAAVGFGTHSELVENCDVYKEIYLSQIGKEAD